MVVKSATKKRLLDLGLSEELAHQLATDRKMDEVRTMSINQIEDYTGSQHAAIATRLRILFDHVIRKFFRKPQKYADRLEFGYNAPYRAVVSVANPRSALRFRQSGGLVSGFVINLYGSGPFGTVPHDFDLVMRDFRREVPSSEWIQLGSSVNKEWYPEYYETWVKRNSPFDEGVFNK